MENVNFGSKILLLCLGTDNQTRKLKDVSIDDIRDVFSRFGDLVKILIFSKSIVFKAFLEFTDVKEARDVQKALHNSTLPKLGAIKLFYSVQDKLEPSDKYIQFWEKPQAKLSPKVDDSFTDSSASDKKMRSDYIDKLFIKEQGEDMRKKWNFTYDISSQVSKLTNFREIRSPWKSSDLNETTLSRGLYLKPKIELGGTLSTTDVHPRLEEVKVQTSKVVLVSNLDNVFSSAKELFNLFSTFGNINKLILMHNLQKALVEYQSPESATVCLRNLSGLDIQNTNIKVNYSKYKQIDIKKSFRNEASVQFNEVLTVPTALNRFKTGVNANSKEISSRLLFEVEKSDSIRMLDVYFYIEKLAEPRSIKVLDEHNKSSVQMILSFKDKATAAIIISKFHNTEIKSSRVSISFYS